MSDMDIDIVKNDAETISENKIMKPEDFRVLLHNDDFTTKDFVVNILRSIFNKDFVEATTIMERVHNTGIGVCGIYTQEVAETKVHMVLHQARMHGFPLNCTMEKV